MGTSRRAFLRLIAAVGGGLAGTGAIRAGIGLGAATPVGPPYFAKLPAPGPDGPHGEVRAREKAAELVPERAGLYLDRKNCWREVDGEIYNLLPAERRAALASFFADFMHGEDLAEFAYWLSEVDFSRAASQMPTEDEVHALELWLTAMGNYVEASGGYGPRSAIAKASLVEPEADLSRVSPASLTLSWEEGRALPKEGPEFADWSMILTAHGVCVHAFGRAAKQLLPFARAERARGYRGGGSIIFSTVEAVLGGLQSLQYQDALRRRSQAVLVARVAARGYLLLGGADGGGLVFARLQHLAQAA